MDDSAEPRRMAKLKTLLKQKDEEDNTPLILAVQVGGFGDAVLVVVRQATVMLWGFSSTRLTPFVTSMN